MFMDEEDTKMDGGDAATDSDGMTPAVPADDMAPEKEEGAV
jgi:hypothetical protein